MSEHFPILLLLAWLVSTPGLVPRSCRILDFSDLSTLSALPDLDTLSSLGLHVGGSGSFGIHLCLARVCSIFWATSLALSIFCSEMLGKLCSPEYFLEDLRSKLLLKEELLSLLLLLLANKEECPLLVGRPELLSLDNCLPNGV